jgi:small-conductance mechanosensitive channel
MLAMAILALSLAPGAMAQGTSKATAAPALPERSADVAPFLAKMADQQVRTLLAQVLEERTTAARREPSENVLLVFDRATVQLGARLAQIAAAFPELASAPSLFWQWLTADGADPSAPWRVLASASFTLALAWAAQATAAWALSPLLQRWKALSHGAAGAAVMFVRWLAFLAAVAATYALLPKIGRPSRLITLAIIFTFAGTWIVSRATAVVLLALHRWDNAIAEAGLHAHRLEVALGILFASLFGLELLHDAGVSADARLLMGLVPWLAFGTLLILAFPHARRSVVVDDAASDVGLDPIERFLSRYGVLLLKLSLAAILAVSTFVALLHGLDAFWSGIASFGLLGFFVAALGLMRTPPTTTVEGRPRLPWAATLRRVLRILALVVFTLAFAALWDIDLFQTANTHLGERLARGMLTVTVTVILSYLTWELIRTALDQSALGPPRTETERGEEGGGTAATRLQTFGPVLRNFLFVVVITVAAMVCLSSLGVDIGPLLAGAGVIGIALGFGAQTLVRDIISGVFFLAEDAFRIGEYITVGTTRGTVEGIAIRSLRLRHHRGAIHTVPFGEIKQLTNYSRDWIIMKLEFLLAFDTDLRKVKKLVKEIGKELEADPELGHALLEPVKSQGVRRMEPTGMVVGIKFMAKPGTEVYLLRREVYQRLRDAFEQNGIHFARPQVVVANPAGDSGLPTATIDAASAAATFPQLSSPRPNPPTQT